MSASEAIARLRELHERWMMFDRSMIPVEAEMAKALPALLECAEALEACEPFLTVAGQYNVECAKYAAKARIALLALGGGQ